MIKFQIQWSEKDSPESYQFWFPFETHVSEWAGREAMKHTHDYYPDRLFRLVEITEKVIG